MSGHAKILRLTAAALLAPAATATLAPAAMLLLAPGAMLLVAPAATSAQIRPVPPVLAWAALGVDVRLETRRFTVPGRNFAQARRNLTELGPRGQDGSHSHALTTYDLSLRWKMTSAPPGCRATDVRVQAAIVIDLPRWTRAGKAARRDDMAWSAVERALSAHENLHRDVALVAAWKLRRAVSDLKAGSCAELTRRVNAVTSTARKELEEAQARVDRGERAGIRDG